MESKKNCLTIIVAASENNAIGKNIKIIWNLPDDLQRFKRLTSGHHIIMGRKTFDTFPRLLPNRTHIVISNKKNLKVPDEVIVVNNISDAIDICKNDPNPYYLDKLPNSYKKIISQSQSAIILTQIPNY